MPNREVHVLALVKGEHRFIYSFDQEGWETLVETLCEQAEDPQLSLNWFDAAYLSHKAKRQVISRDKGKKKATRLPG